MDEPSWAEAQCGLLVISPGGSVQQANDTFVRWMGRGRGYFSAPRTIQDLLTVDAAAHWEGVLQPLLQVHGELSETSVELATAGGPLRVLVTAVASPSLPSPNAEVHLLVARVGQRTRYHAELRAARAVAEVAERRARALQECTAAVVNAVRTENVVAALLAAARGTLGSAAARAWLVTGGQLTGEGYPDGPGADHIPPPDPSLAASRGATLDSDGRIVVPLRRNAHLHGILTLLPADDTEPDALGLDVYTAVGQQAGLALDRARLYEHSELIAHELQEALLEIEPLDDPRFDVATAYKPGMKNLEIGGDWHDAFMLSDTVLAISVGDVVGRGLRSAAAMGQLRSAVRAIAEPDTGPGPLLSRLDQFVTMVPDAALATVAYAQLDLTTGDMRYACAGHPPPLLLPRDGPPTLLWQGRSTPLGAYARPAQRPEERIRLAPQDRVVLFTDGLIEHKSHTLDIGLDRLIAAAEAVKGRPVSDIANSLMASTARNGQGGRDDRCLLVATWKGAQFERTIDATLAQLSTARSDLGDWLRHHGVDPAAESDLVLATSEAVANAAEHGSGRRPDEIIAVRAHRHHEPDGTADVVITIHDPGRWRPSEPSQDRGRGLRIIAALVDEFTVREDHGTTVTLRRRL